MADIMNPGVLDALSEEARVLRAELKKDEMNLRIKRLKCTRLESLNNIKKIEYEIKVLEDEYNKSDKKDSDEKE